MKVEEIIAAMKRSEKLNKSWPISEEIKAWADSLERIWTRELESIKESVATGKKGGEE